jgi:ABC-type nitrate/sulfonate/bicarbonate transport system ATPase subunit
VELRKSTLLQLIAGLEAPTAGPIRVGGVEPDGPSDETSIVFSGWLDQFEEGNAA